MPDRKRLSADIDTWGYSVLPRLIDEDGCHSMIESYAHDALYRSRVVMARHGFGQGEYKYFESPLPDSVTALRSSLYRPLAKIANHWNAALGLEARFPDAHADYLHRCHGAGQKKPSPLLSRYGTGDFNCLHQDIYGEEVFPLQVTILLSEPGTDFTGGEFVLTEQRPRRQSRAEVVPLKRGDGVIFPVRHRPVQGTRGVYRATLRHGVSRVHAGNRYTLGIIFHDAG